MDELTPTEETPQIPEPEAPKESPYWAANPEVGKCVAALDERVQRYYDHVESEGYVDLWRASNRACFAGFYTGGALGKVGKQGEFRTVEVNDYGNLHQHLFTMITAQRPTFEARTETVDHKAQTQAPIGVAVAETAWSEKGLRAAALTVADTMLRAGEAYALKRWDPTAGPTYSAKPMMDEMGQPMMGEDGMPAEEPVPAGDVEYTAMHPIDVARDCTRSAERQRWWVPRRQGNRYDLAAQFPDLSDKILKAASILEDENRRAVLVPLREQGQGAIECDDVWIYEGLLDRSPALPDGRLVSYLSPDCVLFDGPLPYREMPLYRAAAKELEGTAFGYSLLWDILAPQTAYNNLLSTITTAAANLGLPTVWQPDGNGLTRQLLQGINVLKGGTVPPQVLDLLKISPELFKLVEVFAGAMERLSGVNATYRGQAGEGQKGLSGAAYALFAARAIEFGSRFQDAYNTFLESITTGTIYDYQDMGAGEYLVTMAGEGNAYRVESFTAGDIDRINRVKVKLSNPMQATTAGRMAMFDALKEIPGAIQTPESAIQVMTTGKLDPATQATQRELENVQRENERLQKGEPVIVLETDNHVRHLPEHLSLLSSPEAREAGNITGGVLAHVAEHMAALRMADPVLLTIQGVRPEVIQAIIMSQTPPPMPGATDGTAPPDGGETTSTADPLAPAPDGMPGQPQMPTDPMSGEQAPMPAGMA